MTDHYKQLMLFPPTFEERIHSKVSTLEDKLDRQRKSQFAKIGKLQKGYDDLLHEFETLKSAICKNSLPVIQHCEIVEIQTRKVL